LTFEASLTDCGGADAVAAAFISFEIVSDGYENLRNSLAQLMNKRPSDIDSKEPDPVVNRVQQALEKLEWSPKPASGFVNTATW
jgi:divalent metal cation (Fe/Co/Zn/Cd) transporter